MITAATPRSFARMLQMTIAGSNDVRDVVIRVGLPESDPVPGGDFRVLVQIEGFDSPYSRHFHGVDELQALLAGCSIIPRLLIALAPTGAKLTWLGDDDLGFGVFAAG